MTSTSEINSWKEKANAGDAESAFLIYITHTDPATGAPQDWDTAWHYLNISFEAGHPDATLVMGTQLVTGERIEKDVPRGVELIKQAKKLGCENADDFAKMLGIDLDTETVDTSVDTSRVDIPKLGLLIMERLKALVESGAIDLAQKTALTMMLNEAVSSRDEMAVANLYGILQNEKELKKLVSNSDNIVGTDSASATFFVEPKKSDNHIILWGSIVALAVLFLLAMNIQ